MTRAVLVAAAGLIALTGCARPPSAPTPTPHPASERILRIMERMRADSAAAAARATRASATDQPDPTTPVDVAMPAGIDMSSFQLPVHYNERVQTYLDLYARQRRGVFAAWFRRMGRYRAYIEERLSANGMPRELVYLAMIESGFEVNATSSASAVGVWQFMSGTARSEGLEVTDWVDERRDPFRSTDAALRHLAALHHQFGSWYLAAAAYNSGSGRIARLLREYGRSKGPDELFWEIQDHLPAETRGYVPGLLAAAIIGQNPQLFHFDDVVPEPPVEFETVVVPPATDLRAVARAAGTTPEVIRSLNARYVRGVTPPGRESVVRVPPGAAGRFAAAFAELPPSERTRPLTRTYTVRPGETLSTIAQRFGTSVAAIQRANRIQRPDHVGVGRELIVPIEMY